MQKSVSIFLLVLTVHLCTFCTNEAPKSRQFGAYYTNVGAKDSITGKYADIVVNIDDDKEFVFPRESGYLPFLKVGDETVFRYWII